MSVAQEKPSTNSIVVLVLGIVSFVMGLGLLTGIPAWILGKKEVAAIDQGTSSASGRTMATIGMWLGIVATVVSILAIVGFMLLTGGLLFAGTHVR